MSDHQYCLISPCRDEAPFARQTLESVIAQTIRPALWVIVDDGSTDDSPRILAEYASQHSWIHIVTRPDRGDRSLGGGVVDAFYTGYDLINANDYRYICKLDLDLKLPPRYFETLIGRMEANPRLGTCSGKPFMNLNGRLIPETCGDEHSVGMTKFYRTDCFQQIGGFERALMWDGIDCHRCRMLGWIAESSNDPELRFVHLRPMGTSHKSWWTGRVRHGAGQHYMGTSLAYIFASAAFRTIRPPLIVGSAGILWGYLQAKFSRQPRYADREFRRFLNRFQWSCLLRGKTRATALVNSQQSHVWRETRRIDHALKKPHISNERKPIIKPSSALEHVFDRQHPK
jgi:glycosyltransferase involved in cell wall biosynthesis